MRRNAVLLAVAAALVALPGLAGAEESPAPTTVAPTTTVPAEAPAAETTLAVGDEASYRAALASLSADASGPHTIDLTADITVDDGTDPTYTGDQDLVIDGHGFTLDGTDFTRLLVVDSPTDAALTLTAVRMVNGSGIGDGGAVQVLNASPVTVAGSTFLHNLASGNGGALAASAAVDISASTFTGNRAPTGNGGAVGSSGATPEVSTLDSSFEDNLAGDHGGAIGPMSTATDTGIERSTFVGNLAHTGGAVSIVDQGYFVNTTIVDNRALGIGGGVHVAPDARAAMWFVTVTGNQAIAGANLFREGRGQFDVAFSIVAEAAPGGIRTACEGPINAQATFVDERTCGPVVSGSPELGPLQDNGGPTLTRLPLPGSPVIDAIPVDIAPQVISDGCQRTGLTGDVDQRGEPRLVDGDHETRISSFHGPRPVEADCDQGAVEAAFVPVPEAPTGPVAASPGFTG